MGCCCVGTGLLPCTTGLFLRGTGRQPSSGCLQAPAGCTWRPASGRFRVRVTLTLTLNNLRMQWLGAAWHDLVLKRALTCNAAGPCM